MALHPAYPDVAATGGGDDMAYIWSTKTSSCHVALSGHEGIFVEN